MFSFWVTQKHFRGHDYDFFGNLIVGYPTRRALEWHHRTDLPDTFNWILIWKRFWPSLPFDYVLTKCLWIRSDYRFARSTNFDITITIPIVAVSQFCRGIRYHHIPILVDEHNRVLRTLHSEGINPQRVPEIKNGGLRFQLSNPEESFWLDSMHVWKSVNGYVYCSSIINRLVWNYRMNII